MGMTLFVLSLLLTVCFLAGRLCAPRE
jgi:hypothetical protein